jgi:SpoVK/Ycf46/Vps4 family AAA+-type ATPase
LILFIDEADAFLGVRGREGSSEGVRAAMNALLSRTGMASFKYMLCHRDSKRLKPPKRR